MKKQVFPEKIGGIIDSVLCDSGYLKPYREFDVMNRWAELVGEKLAAVSECSRVDNGILYVRVSSAPWRQEIVFIKKYILDTIRKETPCTSIRDIVFF